MKEFINKYARPDFNIILTFESCKEAAKLLKKPLYYYSNYFDAELALNLIFKHSIIEHYMLVISAQVPKKTNDYLSSSVTYLNPKIEAKQATN